MDSFFIVHLCVFLAGAILYLFPPQKINYIYGYRTSSSTTNEAVFKFANKLSSRLLMLFSAVTFAVSFAVVKLFHSNKTNWLIFLGLALTIIITELRIKKFKAATTGEK